MKNLQFHYHMEIAFSEPVRNHIYTLKCLPKTTQTQKITECSVRILPESTMQEGVDSFGNTMLYGTVKGEHSLFLVDVAGRAVTGIYGANTEVCDADMTACCGCGTDTFRQDAEEEKEIAVYRYQTPLTRPGERVMDLLKLSRKQAEKVQSGSLCERVRVYTAAVHESIAYQKGITNVNTTAEEALVLESGVCQDFSHILLSLCREEKIPARYVVGMLMGEGESHAWVEIYDNGRWHGFDPTNNVTAEDAHIKISHGRDYQDCSINRGVFTGQAKQQQSILVEVTERKE